MAKERVLKTTVDASGAKRGAKDFVRSVTSMGKSATSASGKMTLLKGGLIAVGGAAAIAAISGIKKATSIFIDFDTQIRKVNSVVGGTKQTMKELSDIARDVGANTNFSASQAAKGLYNLASAGLSVSEQGKSIRDTLYFAGAVAIDLADATDIVSSTMKQFNIEAENTSRITNVMAAAISTSRASADRLKNSLMYVGPVAGTMNVSLEETTTVLAKLYDAGMEGSQAGTTLRTAMLRLTAPTGEMKKVLVDLGLTQDDINIKSHGLINVFDKLEKAQMSEAQAAKLFGQEGINIIRVIRSGKEELEKYRKKITDTDKATQMYKDQTDGTAGKMDKLKSAVHELYLKIGKDLNPTLQDTIDITTKGVKATNKWYDTVLNGFLSFEAFIMEGLVTLKDFISTALKIGANIGSALLKGLTGVAGGIFYGIVEIVRNTLKWITNKVFDVLKFIAEVTKEIQLPKIIPGSSKFNSSIKKLGSKFEDATEKVRNFVLEVGSVEEQQNRLKYSLMRLGDSIEEDLNVTSLAWDKFIEKMFANKKLTDKTIDELAGNTNNNFNKGNNKDKLKNDKGEKDKTKTVKDEVKKRKNIMKDFLTSVGVEMEDQKEMFKSWADSFTESFANSLMEGKLLFDDFFKSILNKLLQLQIQKSITTPLFEGLGLLETNITGKAVGGPVLSNNPYIVGERGPELFIPDNHGKIIPNNKLGAPSSNPVQINVINNAPVEIEQGTRREGNVDIVDITINTVKRAFSQGKFDDNMRAFGVSRKPGY